MSRGRPGFNSRPRRCSKRCRAHELATPHVWYEALWRPQHHWLQWKSAVPNKIRSARIERANRSSFKLQPLKSTLLFSVHFVWACACALFLICLCGLILRVVSCRLCFDQRRGGFTLGLMPAGPCTLCGVLLCLESFYIG